MEPVLSFGGADITILEIVIGALLVLTGLLVGLFARSKPSGPDPVSLRLQEELSAMRAAQSALQGRLAQMSEDTAKRGDLFQKSLDDRLSNMTERVGRSLTEQTERNAVHLKGLNERLEVIDRAQANIKELAGEVSGLQSILSNKQSRGAFGEKQMQALIEQFLPSRSYSFQYTLSNKNRPDAVIHLPGDHLDVVVDCKFPLEAWQRLVAHENTPEEDTARRQFARDCASHIRAISEKYLIAGETHEVALMFLPSEAIYAELHARFQKVVDEGFRRRVVIVSPTTFMATLHTMRAVLKDAVMQEQAGVILKEVSVLLKDTERLEERVGRMIAQYRTLGKTLNEVETSTGKIVKRAANIETLEIDEEGEPTAPVSPSTPHTRTLS
jgi:DNA recombination protein RmuC